MFFGGGELGCWVLGGGRDMSVLLENAIAKKEKEEESFISPIGNDSHEAQPPLDHYQYHLQLARKDTNQGTCGQPISSAPNSTSLCTTGPSRSGKSLKCGDTCWVCIRVAVRGMYAAVVVV
jgi:hypothetical protein